MAIENKDDDQKARGWGERMREYVFGKKGEQIKSAEDAVKKMRKKEKDPKGKLRHTRY